MVTGAAATCGYDVAAVRALLDAVRDPEIPVLTIADLGILRDVSIEQGRVRVVITPTYSGCPALHAIEHDIQRVLHAAGCAEVAVATQLAPAWTTDWLSAAARAKLSAVGIAPPLVTAHSKRALRRAAAAIACPRCGSLQTEQISEFGSTACKALYRCRHCLEPFDYFKCL